MGKKKTKQAKSAVPYVQRLAQDEYVQAQIRTAVGGLRDAYGRARRKGGRAAEDKKLYESLREAATSIRKAAIGIRRKPEPPKRRGRKLAVVALAGGTAVLLSRRKKAKAGSSYENVAGPSASAESDSGGTSQDAHPARAVGGTAN